MLLLGSIAATDVCEATPVFCFWRNLSRGGSTCAEIKFPEKPIALSEDIVEACCPVRLNQPVTLVRNGKVVSEGKIKSVFAVMDSGAGESRRIYFEVSGIDDPFEGSGPPPYPSYFQSQYDLYIVGDGQVLGVAPPSHTVAPDSTLAAVVEYAIASGCLDPLSLSGNPSGPLVPDSVAFTLAKEAEFTEYQLQDSENRLVSIQAVQWGHGKIRYGFAWVSGPAFEKTVYLRGLVDYFIQIDGEAFVVLRDTQAGTGMWGYAVYRFGPDGSPIRVHWDSSWTT